MDLATLRTTYRLLLDGFALYGASLLGTRLPESGHHHSERGDLP